MPLKAFIHEYLLHMCMSTFIRFHPRVSLPIVFFLHASFCRASLSPQSFCHAPPPTSSVSSSVRPSISYFMSKNDRSEEVEDTKDGFESGGQSWWVERKASMDPKADSMSDRDGNEVRQRRARSSRESKGIRDPRVSRCRPCAVLKMEFLERKTEPRHPPGLPPAKKNPEKTNAQSY